MPTVADLTAGLTALTALATADLDRLLTATATAADAAAVLPAVLPDLVGTYQSAAGTVAADWYDDVRDEAAAPSRFVAYVPDPGDPGADILARWGIGPLFADDPGWATAATKLAGGMQRRIVDVARATVSGSAVADPDTDGWQRTTTRGGSCGFCRMLEARGAVYTDTSARFASHDHCRCQAVPAFSGRPRPVDPYKPTARTVTDQDRARVRRWLADNPDAG